MGFVLFLIVTVGVVIVTMELKNNRGSRAETKELREWYNSTYSLSSNDYVVIDTETTGLDPCTCEIIEVGAIRYRDGVEVDAFQSYCKPDGGLSVEAMEINHITADMVADAPAFMVVFDQFKDFIGNDYILGYNVKFDMKFLQTRAGQDIENPAFDVLAAVRGYFPGRSSYKLDAFREDFQLSGPAHSVLGDCRATHELAQRCRELEAKAAAEREAQRLREEAERQARKEAEKARKEKANNALPPKSQLVKLSQAMSGTSDEYLTKAVKILKDRYGISADKIHVTDATLDVAYTRFFGVKLDGQLRYVYLNVPYEQVHTDFVYGMTAQKECLDGVRIYISEPDDLEKIGDLLVKAFMLTRERTF